MIASHWKVTGNNWINRPIFPMEKISHWKVTGNNHHNSPIISMVISKLHFFQNSPKYQRLAKILQNPYQIYMFLTDLPKSLMLPSIKSTNFDFDLQKSPIKSTNFFQNFEKMAKSPDISNGKIPHWKVTGVKKDLGEFWKKHIPNSTWKVIGKVEKNADKKKVYPGLSPECWLYIRGGAGICQSHF